jgi:hypothetical protein
MREKKFSFEPTPEQTERHKREILENIMRIFEGQASNLLGRLRPEIEALKYDSVLGDDVSGRIPALIMGTAIKEIYGDRKKLNAIFVQGGRLMKDQGPFIQHVPLQGPVTEEEAADEFENIGYVDVERPTTHAQEVGDYLERMRPMLGKNTLLVTEEINSGSSLDIIMSTLESLGIECDAVSFGATGPSDDEPGVIATPEGRRILIGDEGRSGDFGQDEYTGLEAGKYKARSGRGHAVRAWNQNRKHVVLARALIKELGHKLAQQYLSKK